MEHQILTPAECLAQGHGFSDFYCPICDGGLAYCKVCKKAESELIDCPECPGDSRP